MNRQRLHVNHFAEAERCLSQASHRRSDRPDAAFVNPESAAVLASMAQAHATLAHLPEQQVVAQEQLAKTQADLDAMRRLAGNFIGSILADDRSESAQMAGHLVRALRDRGLSVDGQITARMKSMGTSYDPGSGEPANTAEERLERALATVVRCVWEMSFNQHQDVRVWARDLMEQLDEAGANIDDRVDELSRQRGKGPNRFDVFGRSYDLTRQYVDVNGKRWEHTGSWTDTEVPVMRRDEPDGDRMTLPELIRERGPLKEPLAHSTEAPF